MEKELRGWMVDVLLGSYFAREGEKILQWKVFETFEQKKNAINYEPSLPPRELKMTCL